MHLFTAYFNGRSYGGRQICNIFLRQFLGAETSARKKARKKLVVRLFVYAHLALQRQLRWRVPVFLYSTMRLGQNDWFPTCALKIPSDKNNFFFR